MKRITLPSGKQKAVSIVQPVFCCFVGYDAPALEEAIRNIEDLMEHPEGFPGDESAADFWPGKSRLVENENIQSLPGQNVPGRGPGRTCSGDQDIDCVGIRQTVDQGVKVNSRENSLSQFSNTHPE